MLKNEYVIKFTPIAYEDLDNIYGYISQELFNNDAAIKLMNDFEIAILKLSLFPFLGSFIRDDTLRLKNYRKLIVNNYIVFYVVDESKKFVIIMRILYAKRDYCELI